MLEVGGDIWEAHALGHWIVITTNGIVRKDGACVMGRGVARDAALRYPKIPYQLGEAIRNYGNIVFAFQPRIYTFPVKHHWRDRADLKLIERSARQLADRLQGPSVTPKPVYLVRPGCGNGQLAWEDVRAVIAPILDDRFIVVHP